MDLVIQVIFFITAALIVGAATMVVTVKNIIHAALWLISTFFGVGMLYLLMEAEFLAISQVLIYIGAVSVLMLFAIMLTRQVTGSSEPPLYTRWWASLLVVVVLFGGILVPTFGSLGYEAPVPAPDQPIEIAGTAEIGMAFMQQYLLPFQVAAVLLLIALVGAIVIAYEGRAERRVLTLAERFELQKAQQKEAQGQPTTNGEQEPDTAYEASDDKKEQAEAESASDTEPQPTTIADDDEEAVIKNIPR